jgi:hypothetical protein
LEWSTQQEQVDHVIKNGLKIKKQFSSKIIKILSNGASIIYDGVVDASRKEYLNQPTISGWLIGKSNPSDGSKWMYKSDYDMSEEDLKLEEWRPVIIDSKETGYFISSLGRFKRNKNIRKGRVQYGYFQYSITINGKKNFYKSHRLVAFAFLGNPPTPEHTVDHINRNKLDNRVENLRWATGKEQCENSTQNRKNNSKCVIQFSKDGKELKRFKNIAEAYNQVTGKSGKGPCIAKVCRHEREFAHNYRWSFVEDNYKPRQITKINFNQPLVKVCKDGTIIYYDNIKQASEIEKYKDLGSIRLRIRGKIIPSDGSKWYLKYEYDKL